MGPAGGHRRRAAAEGTGIVKRILVLTADAGFGHRSAVEAVAAALEKRYGDRCAVTTANPMGDERVVAPIRASQSVPVGVISYSQARSPLLLFASSHPISGLVRFITPNSIAKLSIACLEVFGLP